MSSAWIPRTSRTGIEYGGTSSDYYWNEALNPGASYDAYLGTYDLALPNCTTYAFGRCLEGGSFAPISGWHNASAWDDYVINGWTVVPYSLSALEPGDLVVWDTAGRNHVAVVENIEGSSVYVSESYYTSDNGTASGDRSPAVWGSTKASVNAYGIANYPNRYFHYGLITSAYGVYPDKILKNPVDYTVGSIRFIGQKKRNRIKRRII